MILKMRLSVMPKKELELANHRIIQLNRPQLTYCRIIKLQNFQINKSPFFEYLISFINSSP